MATTAAPAAAPAAPAPHVKVTFPPHVKKQLEDLKNIQKAHDFWNNNYFKACKEGSLTKDDFGYIFSQYFLYSRNFTRYLTAIMTNCESDYYRALLSANLWEEGGGVEPSKRHANIFRNFLVNTFSLNLEKLNFHEHTQHYYRQYLEKCIHNDPIYGSAFLSLGTEGIVAPMYTIMVEGMKKAGIADENLEFFFTHMACDDEHAETLEEMMASYHEEPGWYATCLRSMEEALTLRKEFFNALVAYVESRKKQNLPPDFHATPAEMRLARADSKFEIGNPKPKATANSMVLSNSGGLIDLPQTCNLRAGVQILSKGQSSNIKIPVESYIYVFEGQGQIQVGSSQQILRPGDSVYIPANSALVIKSVGDVKYLVTSSNPDR